MRLLRGFLVALAVIAPAAVCNAAFVIDDFMNSTLSQTTLANDVTRRVDSSPSNTTSTVGAALVAGTNASPALTATPKTRLFYSSFGGNDLSAFTGVETFVTLGTVTNNSGSALTVVAYKNSANNINESVVVNSGESKSLLFAFSNLGAWTSLIVDFNGTTGQAFDFTANAPLVLSAVPEPTSLALIGCVAAGGAVASRRRRKAVAAMG